MTQTATSIDTLCINTIRTLAMDAVQKAGNGHPGTPMGAATMAYVLFTRHLRHNPANPDWFGRDRFVLSAGHASVLQYALLHLCGYDLPIEELESLRQWGSRTPGHPERGLTPGVEVTTGPLGQGFAMGVGMAIAERYIAARLPGVFDHYTYGIVSDGDLMEGVAAEAASLAGTMGLGRLIYLYDDNGITIDGPTGLAFTEDAGDRFEAYGWHVQRIDGDDIDAVDAALTAAREDPRPSLIAARTIIGHGSPNKGGTAAAHGAALGEEEVRLTKQALGWPEEAQFSVPEEVRSAFAGVAERGAQLEAEAQVRYDEWAAAHPDEARGWERHLRRELPAGWDAPLPEWDAGEKLATREASGKVLNAIARNLPYLIGGSADLTGSNNTYLEGHGDLGIDGWEGRNIRFGVREHAMAAAMNGMAAHGGVRPFVGTFLVFSDYMRPAIRLAAIQEVPSIFVFTHDSIGVGEDGPTHQPIEHLASLRAIPGLTVVRPADANEVAFAWQQALQEEGPVALILSRQGLPVLGEVERMRDGVKLGGYVVADSPTGRDDVALIATGSEVSLAMAAREQLAGRGIGARVVSMPSWEWFAAAPAKHREAVLPPGLIARLSVEAAATFGWERWTGEHGEAYGLDRFGASAPGGTVMRELGFTPERVAERAEAVVNRLRESGGAR